MRTAQHTGWVYNDGGRGNAGFTGEAGDCVTRSIAIAAKLDYRVVYDTLNAMSKLRNGGPVARTGVTRKIYEEFLKEIGWVWTPTMHFGQGCKVHLAAEELPSGALVVKCSKHLTAVLDGVVHDTHDPRREGTRTVYGFYKEEGGMMTETLRNALDLIRDPQDWNQGALFRRVDGRPTRCALGAIGGSSGANPTGTVFSGQNNADIISLAALIDPDKDITKDDICNGRKLVDMRLWMETCAGPFSRAGTLIAWYNNTHSHEEVVALFEKAIAQSEGWPDPEPAVEAEERELVPA